MKRDRVFFYILLSLVIVFSLLEFLTPLVAVVNHGLVLEGIFLEELIGSLVLSIVTSAISAFIAVFIAIPTGFYIHRFMRGLPYRLVLSLLMIPVAVAPSATGVLLLMFFKLNPIGSSVDSAIGVVNDVKGVIVAQLTVTYPMVLSYYIGLFTGVPRVYEELAIESGLTHTGYLYKVLIPMLRGRILAGYALAFARSFGDFGASLILGGGIRGKTWTFPILVYYTIYMGNLASISITLLVYIALAFLLYYVLLGLESTSTPPGENI